jgi:hypothetical protein
LPAVAPLFSLPPPQPTANENTIDPKDPHAQEHRMTHNLILVAASVLRFSRSRGFALVFRPARALEFVRGSATPRGWLGAKSKK